MRLPRYIGICGNPGSGKSEVQRILRDRYSVQPVDDGYALRDFCQIHLGMSYDDVHTQSGKAGWTIINGRRWNNRKVLGEFGLALEATFGVDIIHWMAARRLPAGGCYSFGSVRRNAEAIKAEGGILLAVRNPFTQVRENEFDGFRIDLIDVWIDNDVQDSGLGTEAGLGDLEAKVVAAIESLGRVAA